MPTTRSMSVCVREFMSVHRTARPPGYTCLLLVVIVTLDSAAGVVVTNVANVVVVLLVSPVGVSVSIWLRNPFDRLGWLLELESGPRRCQLSVRQQESGEEQLT